MPVAVDDPDWIDDGQFSIGWWKPIFTKSGHGAFLWAWNGSLIPGRFAASRYDLSSGRRWLNRCCA